MRKATKEETADCLDFLSENEFAVLATASRLGRPDAATITYMIDKEWNVYFFTRESSIKGGNMRKNKHVSLVVGTGPDSRTAQLSGKVSRLSEADAGVMLDKFLAKRDGFYMTFLKLEGYDFVGYKLKPSRVRWLQIPPGVRKEDIVEISL